MNGASPRGDSRGYPDGGLPQAQGPGPGRPPMGRAPNSVPGTQQYTRAASLKSTYPQDTSWNNSYPSFPTRKPSNPRNYDLTRQFGNIDINAQQDDRTRSMDSQYAPRTFSLGNGPQQNGRGQSQGYNGGHPQQSRQQQGYQEPSRGPSDSGYAADGYNENIMTTGPPLPASLLPAAEPRAAPQQPQYDQGHNDGYNAAPPTNAGHKKEDSVGDVYDAYFGDDGKDPNRSTYKTKLMVVDGGQAPIPVEEPRSMSADRSRAGKQDDLFLGHQSVDGAPSQFQDQDKHFANYQEFDRRSHTQAHAPLIPPKISIYDGTRSASAAPDSRYQGFQGSNANNWDQNQQQNAYGAPPPQRGPQPQQSGYPPPQDQYDPGPAGFAPPQRSMTALDPAMGGFGPPQRSMTALDPAMGGFGPPQRSITSQDVTMGGRGLPPRSATPSISSLSKGESTTSLPSIPSATSMSSTPTGTKPGKLQKRVKSDAISLSSGPGMGLPAHPAPYRPGLQNMSNGNHMPMTNKPPPIRNYQGGIVDAPARVNTPQPPTAPSGPPSQKKEAPVTSVTTQEIDQLRVAINSNPNDQVTTLLLARKLVLAAETLTASIPDNRQRTKTREKWIMEAHKLLKKLVAMNNTDAMFYLADCYGRGALGLETSPAQAFSLYQSAAKAGHAAAAYRTAVCCEIGQDDGGGTRKDPLKAMQWYKRAATLGDTPAMYKMGMIQLKGLLGQPINNREAVMWLKRAAERADKDNPHALHELALLYSAPQSGEGSVMRDEGYSLELFRQAAELGYKFSQFKMGCAYEFGLFNLPISPKESIQWYSKAAVQEEHQSELALSGWYLTGAKDDRTQGVILAQSDTEAYLWARKAAVAGLAKAEYAMGYFTETGIGCVKDLDGAKRWYWRAAGKFNLVKCRSKHGS